MAAKSPEILLSAGKTSKDGEVSYLIEIDGKSFDVFFRSADVPLYSGVEPALPLALLGAMRTRSNLRVLSPVSQTYARNVQKVTTIYSGWFRQFSRVAIHADRPVQASPAFTGRVGVFFSGGVDAFYTLLRNLDDITDLIFIHGFDVRLDDVPRRRMIDEMGRAVAKATGKRFIQIESNFGQVIQEYGLWTLHGGGLALESAARMLQGYVDRIYISSDKAFQDLIPWSLHPATVPLFNDEALSLILYGSDATRVEKIESISGSDLAMQHLRVCWGRVGGKYNCGECEKCFRTMTSLYALGVLDACPAFDRQIDVNRLRRTLLLEPGRNSYIDQNLTLMEDRGLKDTPVYEAWKHVRQRPLWLAKRLHKYRKRWARLKRDVARLSHPRDRDRVNL
jgi:hypothetical protein